MRSDDGTKADYNNVTIMIIKLYKSCNEQQLIKHRTVWTGLISDKRRHNATTACKRSNSSR